MKVTFVCKLDQMTAHQFMQFIDQLQDEIQISVDDFHSEGPGSQTYRCTMDISGSYEEVYDIVKDTQFVYMIEYLKEV